MDKQAGQVDYGNGIGGWLYTPLDGNVDDASLRYCKVSQ